MAYSTSPLYTKNSHMLTQEPNPPVQLRPRKLSSTSATSRSCIAFLFKFFIFALFLITIALFPSQAPDFVNQTILDKFWELFHLLFVGIAVSYGLFSCRAVVDVDIVHGGHYDDDDDDNFESRMGNALSLFEDGHENPCGSREKKMSYSLDADFMNESSSLRKSRFQDECHSWSSQYFPGESVVVVAQGNSCPEDLAHKPLGLPVRSLRFTSDSNGFEARSGTEEVKGMNNASKNYFVGDDEYIGQNDETNVEETINVCDNIRSNIGNNSLALPIRKLRLSTRSTDSYEVSSGGESSSSRKSYSSSFFNGNIENLGQKGVVDLEKLNELSSTIGCESFRLPVHSMRGTNSPRYSSGRSESGVCLRSPSMSSERSKDGDFSEQDLEKVKSGNTSPNSSPVPQKPRSGTWRKLGGEDRDYIGPHSHLRPLSVDESQFESFKSHSFGSLVSDSSQGSSISYPLTKHPHYSSISPEVPDLKMKERRGTQRLPESFEDVAIPSEQVNREELGRKTSFRRRYTWASRYRTDSLGSKPSSNTANFQRCSQNEALSNITVQKKFEHDLQDLDSNQGEDSFANREQCMDSSLNPCANLDEASLDSPSTTEQVNDEASVKPRRFRHSPASSSSPPEPSNDKIAASSCSRTTIGAEFGEDVHKSFEADPEDPNKSRKEDYMAKKEQYMDSLSYAKAPSLTRAFLPRAKSVRTRRSKKYMAEANKNGAMSEKWTDNMAGKVYTGVQDIHTRKNGMTTREVEYQIPVVKDASSQNHEKEKHQPAEKYVLESQDKLEIEGANIRASSEGDDRGSNISNAGEDYSSEVDKKAGEFIAKFREQIRLQKMSSIGDSGELQMGRNYF